MQIISKESCLKWAFHDFRIRIKTNMTYCLTSKFPASPCINIPTFCASYTFVLQLWQIPIHTQIKTSFWLLLLDYLFQLLWLNTTQPILYAHSRVALVAKNLVWPFGWEDPLEEEMVTYSSILAWTIPWTGAPRGSHRVGQDWSNCMHGIKNFPLQHFRAGNWHMFV